MAGSSSIEWTEASWNPVRGCRRCSPGCEHCYAEGIAARFSGTGLAYEGLAKMTKAGPRWTGKGLFVDDALDAPLRWRKPRRIFVNSMSDLFFEEFTVEQIAQVFAVMYLAPRHTFQVLTKRAGRMREVLNDPRFNFLVRAAIEEWGEKGYAGLVGPPVDVVKRPASWVHLGVSIENQKYADLRLVDLEATPAGLRFVSLEPLLDEVDLRRQPRSPWHLSPPETWHGFVWPDWVPASVRQEVEQFWSDSSGRGPREWLRGQDGYGSGYPRGFVYPAFGERGDFHLVGPGERTVAGRYVYAWNSIGRVVTDDGKVEVVSSAVKPLSIRWVIVGGESGPGARPFDVEWARSVVDQCTAAGVPVFVKQLGAHAVGGAEDMPQAQAARFDREGIQVETWESFGLELKNKKGNEMAEWPEDLRRREFPEARRG